MTHRARGLPRNPPWTEDALLDAIRERCEQLGLRPGDFAPLSGQLGSSLCNAAHKHLGGKDAACARLGLIPNGKGGSRAAKMAGRKAVEVPAVKPRPVLVRDPVVTRERKASERRQARSNWRDCTFRTLGPRHMEIHQPSQELYLAHVIGPRVPGEARTERAA